jgi:hypothetical protein
MTRLLRFSNRDLEAPGNEEVERRDPTRTDDAIRDLMPWITSRETLLHMTSLRRVVIRKANGSKWAQEWDLLFPLLLTSTSLQQFQVYFWRHDFDDAVMSALARYLGATSLVPFYLATNSSSLEAAFTYLCDGVAQSSSRTLCLLCLVAIEANLATAAEFLARAIIESSLDEATAYDTHIVRLFHVPRMSGTWILPSVGLIMMQDA